MSRYLKIYYMVAESQSAEKEMMMNVIMNCIGK